MIGTAILIQNADCGPALQQFPSEQVNKSFAVSFVATNSTEQAHAQEFVKTKIAKLKVDRLEFDRQAEVLTQTNIVYKDKEYRKDLVAHWVPDPAVPVVPPIVVDAVVAVPLEGSPGTVVAEGLGDATAAGESDRMDSDIAAAREARYIAAFEPEVQDLNGGNRGSMQVAALMQQLEELDQAAQRSVAAEVESAIESQLGEGACLVDEAGRARILEICEKVRKSCIRLDDAAKQGRLQLELQKTAMGEQEWQAATHGEGGSGTIPHLL